MVSEKSIQLFESILKSVVMNFTEKKVFGFIGFVGSMNYDNDIDLIFCPSKSAKIGDFFIEQLKLLKKLNKNLKAKQRHG